MRLKVKPYFEKYMKNLMNYDNFIDWKSLLLID